MRGERVGGEDTAAQRVVKACGGKRDSREGEGEGATGNTSRALKTDRTVAVGDMRAQSNGETNAQTRRRRPRTSVMRASDE